MYMQKKPFSFCEIFPRAERFDLNYFQFPECSLPLTSALIGCIWGREFTQFPLIKRGKQFYSPFEMEIKSQACWRESKPNNQLSKRWLNTVEPIAKLIVLKCIQCRDNFHPFCFKQGPVCKSYNGFAEIFDFSKTFVKILFPHSQRLVRGNREKCII